MDNLKKYELIRDIVGKENILMNEKMSRHTTFKVGGNADLFVKVKTLEQIKKIFELNIKDPITVIGNGSNLLVKDNGIRGIVIKYIGTSYKINENYIEVESGMTNGLLAKILLDNGLSGYEFASGIPGTVGGAIYMNAGAYGTEIADILMNVRYLDLDDLEIYEIDAKECELTYRNSIFMKKNCIILSGKFKVICEEKDKIEKRMKEYLQKRISTQPTEYPNAGSTFKRENGCIVAELIDKAGLKGHRIGDAEVSTKHAGFIINRGNATAKDILDLIEYIKKTIYEKYNVEIKLEVRVIGE